MKHLKSYKSAAKGRAREEAINEVATKQGTNWLVQINVPVKQGLLSAFRKKAQTEHNRDLGETWSDAALAEYLVTYVTKEDSYLNIESLPVGPILGIEAGAQPTAQPVQGAQPVAQPVQGVQAVQGVQPVPTGGIQPVQGGQDLPPAAIQQ